MSELDREVLMAYAEAERGKPYSLRRWSTQEHYDLAPNNFDCSSFVMWCFFRMGYKIPRTSQAQYNYCNPVTFEYKKKGDLWFLGRKKKKNQITHVGFYAGGGMMIQAAGGRADKVIKTFTNKTMNRPDFIGWGRIPISEAEDDFFKWIKRYPKKKKK